MNVDGQEAYSIPGHPSCWVTRSGIIWKRLVPKLHKNGYASITLQRNHYQLASVLLMTFVGPCPEGMEPHHKDGNKHNNDLSNLAWSRPADHRGRKAGTGSVLNAMQVRVIHHLLESGEFTHREIAIIFGLDNYNGGFLVSEIKRGKAWSSVTGRSKTP